MGVFFITLGIVLLAVMYGGYTYHEKEQKFYEVQDEELYAG